MILKTLLNNQSTQINSDRVVQPQKWLAPLFLIISFISFLDSSYLVAKHYLGGIVPCTFGGCEKVLTSSYSIIMGVPVALFGAVYYLIFIGTCLYYFDSENERIIKYLSFYSIIGFIASFWFMVVQLFVIKSICEFCMLSAISSSTLFVSGMIYLAKNRKSY